MLRGGLVVFLCAWVALTLPWERCHAACHDRVLPAGTAHECHHGHGHGHDHDHDHDHDKDGNSDHDPVQFEGVAPAPTQAPTPAAV